MFELDEESKEYLIGSVLRYHRELRKLDLDFVAEQLKIRREYVVAMEQDQFDLLPEGVYRRSFLKAYARFLKLDPDHILKVFDEQHKEEEDQIEERIAWKKAHLGENQENRDSLKRDCQSKRLLHLLGFHLS